MKLTLIIVVVLMAKNAQGANWPKVGLKFEPPKAAVPDSYRQQPGAAGTNSNMAASSWWTTLGDPELTGLIGRAVKANLDLKAATSRVLEARAGRRVTLASLMPTVKTNGSILRVRGGLTQGLFEGPSGVSGLLAPVETSIHQISFDSTTPARRSFARPRISRGLEAPVCVQPGDATLLVVLR